MTRCSGCSCWCSGANIAIWTQAIHALEESGRADVLTLRRLKKQKLALKDRIARIEDDLTPDIIA